MPGGGRWATARRGDRVIGDRDDPPHSPRSVDEHGASENPALVLPTLDCQMGQFALIEECEGDHDRHLVIVRASCHERGDCRSMIEEPAPLRRHRRRHLKPDEE